MIDGQLIRLSGQDWIVPALNFRQLKALKAEIVAAADARSGILSDEQLDAIVKVVHAALSRNYPEMKLEAVADMVDLRNASEVISAVLGSSGVEVGKAPAAQS